MDATIDSSGFQGKELHLTKVAARRCSVKKLFLEISQNSQESACARVSFLKKNNFIKKETLAQLFSCEFCKISKNTFSYRTPLVVASDLRMYKPQISKIR